MITLKDILIYYFAEILNMTSNRPLQLIKEGTFLNLTNWHNVEIGYQENWQMHQFSEWEKEIGKGQKLLEMRMVKVNFHHWWWDHWNAHCQQLMKLAHDFADEKLMEDNFHPSIDHLFTAHDFEIWQGNGSILLDAISSSS